MRKAQLLFAGVAGTVGTVVGSVVMAAQAHATDYADMFTPAQTEGTDAVTQVIPKALAVGILVLGVVLGWKLFRRIVGR